MRLFYEKFPLSYFFITPIILGFFVLPMVQRGMFQDGLHYAIISRNWADDIGDMWHLYWQNLIPFHDHPPLFFILEGSLFYIFGDPFWVEGVFMLLVLAGHLYLLLAITRRISLLAQNKILWEYRGLVLFIYLIESEVAHTFNSNLLDVLLSLFTLLATYCILKGFAQYDGKKWLAYACAGGSIFLGYLSKGPVALFPLALPFFYYGMFRKQWVLGFLHSLFMFGITAFLGLVLILNSPDAFAFLRTYHQLQVFSTLESGVDPHVIQAEGRRAVNAIGWISRMITFFPMLLGMLVLPIITCVLAYGYHRWKGEKGGKVYTDRERKTIFVWLLFALAASSPILLSPSIFSRYLVPSLPFYALGFVLILLPFLRKYLPATAFINPIWKHSLFVLSLLLLLACGVLFGKSSRDKDEIAIASMLRTHVTKHEIIYTDLIEEDGLKRKDAAWNARAILVRYAYVYPRLMSEIVYDTPTYLLLSKKASEEKYKDALKVYQPIDSCLNYVLYKYAGGKD